MWKCLSLLTLVALLALSGTTSLAAADSSDTALPAVDPLPSPRAVVIRDSGCVVLDGVGSPVLAETSQVVITNNGNGRFTCQVQGVTPGPDGVAIMWNLANTGFMCYTYAGLTDQWQEVVTPSGVATFTCLVKK